MVVFTRGHAFAGLWLKPEEFSTTVVDDVTALRKRLKLKELVLFETTLITQRPAVPFIGSHMEAVNHGMQTRKELRDFIAEKGMDPKQVLVPADGESYSF